jgi:uncharacterized membrane protein
MRSLGENHFHILMACLLVGSLFLDQAARNVLPTWSSPRVGVVTFALGLVWIGLFASYRQRLLHDRIKVLEDRLDRVSRKADLLEDDARRRRDVPLH